jgi:hypothetical protein
MRGKDKKSKRRHFELTIRLECRAKTWNEAASAGQRVVAYACEGLGMDERPVGLTISELLTDLDRPEGE